MLYNRNALHRLENQRATARSAIIHVMKSTRKPPASTLAKAPAKAAIRRAVASSTAIETGQTISRIERSLRASDGKFRNLKLAR